MTLTTEQYNRLLRNKIESIKKEIKHRKVYCTYCKGEIEGAILKSVFLKGKFSVGCLVKAENEVKSD